MNEQRTGWTGWVIFASVLMMIAGALHAFTGLVAVVSKDWIVWTNQGSMYLSFNAWGWTHMAIGALVFLAGVGLLTGNIVARVVAVALASISLIANFLFIPAYPFWALTVMVLDAIVIYAVCAHGGEMKSIYGEESVIDVRAPEPAPRATGTPAGAPLQ